jgi:Flp pilus assembly protein TadB
MEMASSDCEHCNVSSRWAYQLVWVICVLLLGLAFRPRPNQHLALRNSPYERPPSLFAQLMTRVGTPFTQRLELSADPEVIGRVLVLSSVATLIQPLLGVVCLVLSVVRIRRKRRDAVVARVASVRHEMSLLIDLLRVAVSSGLTLQQAIGVVCGSSGEVLAARGELACALSRAVDAVQTGERFVDSLGYLADDPHIGHEVRPLVSAFLNSEQFGAPLDPALASLADEVRELRRRHGEMAARRVPVRMLAPLVLLLLPSFALLTIAPLLAGGLGSLSLHY